MYHLTGFLFGARVFLSISTLRSSAPGAIQHRINLPEFLFFLRHFTKIPGGDRTADHTIFHHQSAFTPLGTTSWNSGEADDFGEKVHLLFSLSRYGCCSADVSFSTTTDL